MDRKDWLKWRKGGIGSSDASAIMGVSKFMTIMELYEQKIAEEVEEEKGSFIMDVGNELEPRVRSLYSILDGDEYEVALVVREEAPYLRASLDGRGVANPKKIIEIKLLGKEDYEAAMKGVVPPQYVPQVQHQLMVTDASVCVFLAYPHGEYMKDRRAPLRADLLAQINVYPDMEYWAKLIEAESRFWIENVEKRRPPAPSSEDYVMLKGQARALNKWKKLKVKVDELSAELEAAREEIIELAKAQGHNRYLSNGVRIRQESRQGNVDYKKIPAVKAMKPEELDQYRGKGSVSWKMEIVE